MVSIRNLVLLILTGAAIAVKPVTRLDVTGLHSTSIKINNRATTNTATYSAHNLSVPVDHFRNSTKYEPHTDEYFNLRYFFDASNYKPGGPVILIAGAEASADLKLYDNFADGIVPEIAKATGGIIILLEHRYYGTSFPPKSVVPDLHAESMRFLTTEQALEDTAYLAKHVKFPGLEQYNLAAPHTPWIAYGGSYSGGFVAFLRTLYPGVFWGAISSSGITKAIADYWQYQDVIVEFGPKPCITYQQKLTHIIDTIYASNKTYVPTLKSAFGLGGITTDGDFISTLSSVIGSWQARNWDPAVSSYDFMNFCSDLTAPQRDPAAGNVTETAKTLIEAGGYGKELNNLTTPLVNWIGYIKATFGSDYCDGTPQADCFNPYPADVYQNYSLSNRGALSWTWQTCTQWGLFQTGAGTPADKLPIISRQLTLHYKQTPCRLAWNITEAPDVNAINQWGGYDVNYPRLFIVGGEADPWRDVTPVARQFWPKVGTEESPVTLIRTPDYGAVHHWDTNGVPKSEYTEDFPPAEVLAAQSQKLETVKLWLKEFAQQ